MSAIQALLLVALAATADAQTRSGTRTGSSGISTRRRRRIGTGAIIGIVVAIVVALIICLIVVWLLQRRRKRARLAASGTPVPNHKLEAGTYAKHDEAAPQYPNQTYAPPAQNSYPPPNQGYAPPSGPPPQQNNWAGQNPNY